MDERAELIALRRLAELEAKAAGTSAPAATTAPPMSRAAKFAEGLADPIAGGAQLLTKMLPESVVSAGNRANNWLADKTGMVARLPEGGVDQQVRERETAYQAQRGAAGESGFDAWRMAGNVLNPANVALASRLPAAANLLGRVGVGAAGGAASGLLAPVTEGEYLPEKAKQVAAAAAGGGVMPVLTGGLARAISPNASRNPNVALLRGEGVQPTVGQTLGGRWNAAEEKLQSVPLVGDAIAMARRRPVEQFNNAAINRATAAVGGPKVKGSGQQAVAEAGDILSAAYDDALAGVKFVRFDAKFGTDLTQLQSMTRKLKPAERARFDAELKDTLGGRISTTGTMLGDTYKKVDSDLGKMAASYRGSSTASERELGDAVAQMQNLLREQMARSNPEAARKLAAADEGWANLVRVEGAAKAGKNAEGHFTPAQLNAAVQATDRSVRKRAVSRGEALMQDLGNAGQQVISNRVPDSGTAGRLAMGGGLGALGYMDPFLTGGVLAGGMAMYTPPVQNLLRAFVASRPELAEPIANALRRGSPALIPGAAQIGLNALK